MITREDMATFVKTEASVFPDVRRALLLVARFEHSEREGGIAFIGDSAHSFPKDAGQGLSAARKDVEAVLDTL